MTELIKDYFDMPIGTYLNQSIEINEVTLTCDVYRLANSTVLTSSVFTGCTANDANTQIIIGKNMSVASGTTLTPPYRCKGIIIGDTETFTNAGTISMTARGASGAGKNIQLTADYMISATGGSGGAAHTGWAGGNNGSSPSSGILACGGGGSGASINSGGTAGKGGNGTSFSGGAGSGGIVSQSGSTSSGSDTGGAGSDGYVNKSFSSSGKATGGVGNPSGATSNDTPVSPSGTGGLIVIIAETLVNNGSLVANGVTAATCSTHPSSDFNESDGGSSGGGCIVTISSSKSGNGTLNTDGGSRTWTNNQSGGAGGAGAKAQYIVENLILQNLPVEFAITDTDHLDNIDPSEAVRFLGLTDDDELYYDIMGKRHSSGSGHIVEDEEGTSLAKRKVLTVNSPLTVEDDSTNEKTVIGADTSGSLDFTQIVAPGVTHDPVYGNPVGTVISFFGYEAPLGYLVCDGTEYAKADYPYLAIHLADLDDHYSTTQYEGSDGDHFKVPDLRGEFLRGSGTNSHTNQGNGGNVGVHQDATVMPGIANSFISANKMYLDVGGTAGMSDVRLSETDTSVLGTGSANMSSTNNLNVTYPRIQKYTARPTNTSVLYCIKYN